MGRAGHDEPSPPRRLWRAGFLLAFAFVLAAASAGGSGGCRRRSETLSGPEYKRRVAEIHDGVAWDLGYVLESLGEVSGDEYYHLQEAGEAFANVKGIFSRAYGELDVLQPPEEALELHLDLLHFYADGERETGTVVNSLGLFQIALPMLADVDNLALPSLPEQPQPQEIRGAAEEDARTVDDYLDELRDITPPDEMRQFLERLLALFAGIKDMVQGVLQAPPSKEVESLTDYRQRFAPLLGEAEALRYTVRGYLAGVGGRIDVLIERGRALASRIKEL